MPRVSKRSCKRWYDFTVLLNIGFRKFQEQRIRVAVIRSLASGGACQQYENPAGDGWGLHGKIDQAMHQHNDRTETPDGTYCWPEAKRRG